jgi:hypothetical protein
VVGGGLDVQPAAKGGEPRGHVPQARAQRGVAAADLAAASRASARSAELKTQPVPHAAQAFRIERTVRDPHTGELRCAAAALGITSRGPERGGTPEVIATAARGYWDIEALHHVRDTTLDEMPAALLRVIRPGHGSHQEAVPSFVPDMCHRLLAGPFRRTEASTSPIAAAIASSRCLVACW